MDFPLQNDDFHRFFYKNDDFHGFPQGNPQENHGIWDGSG
jgi:hypothetical protein